MEQQSNYLVQMTWPDGSGDFYYINLEPLLRGYPAEITSMANLTNRSRVVYLPFDTKQDHINSRLTLTIRQGIDSIVSATMEDVSALYEETKAGYTEES